MKPSKIYQQSINIQKIVRHKKNTNKYQIETIIVRKNKLGKMHLRTPTFYTHYFPLMGNLTICLNYYCFYFSFKKKNELFCLVFSDTKHMLSPLNIETRRRANFQGLYITSDQHVHHASTPFCA